MAKRQMGRRTFLAQTGAAAAAASALSKRARADSGDVSAAPKLSEPNILIILTDEQRYPTADETARIQDFRKTQLLGEEAIRKNAIEFHQHYTGSTACAPSRATLWTGHYPSYHGVSQTDGAEKTADGPDMHWLAPGTVPTLGHYFRAGGYETVFKGKWHVSHAVLNDATTGEPMLSIDDFGKPIAENQQKYLDANVLDPHGFSGWIGPEPHGSAQSSCGTIRDPDFARQAAEWIKNRSAQSPDTDKPWLLVCSLVNPHDIAIFGLLYSTFKDANGKRLPRADDTVPLIPAPKTAAENLRTKPSAQADYVKKYKYAFFPQLDSGAYRRFYYYMHKLADQSVAKVYEALKASRFFENTIVVFASDHGDMLGAHGGMHQKWHSSYEECTHTPLMIANPKLFPSTVHVRDAVTSNTDILPTLLGLAGLNVATLSEQLKATHTDARVPVGRDLSDVVLSKGAKAGPTSIYFMTDDEISEGDQQEKVRHIVVQPSHVESVVARIPVNGKIGTWKYVRYWDNPQFHESARPLAAEEFELYHLTNDPHEERNLAFPKNETAESKEARKTMTAILNEERKHKRLTPTSPPAPATTKPRKVGDRLRKRGKGKTWLTAR